MDHYYYLTGTPATIEKYLLLPLFNAELRLRRGIRDPDRAVIYRIGLIVSGIFEVLIAIPLAAVAWGIRRWYREKIDPTTYENEFKAWKPKIVTWAHTNSSHESYVRDHVSEDVIEIVEDLVRARVLAKDCKFDKILMSHFRTQVGNNMFTFDGKFAHVTPKDTQSEKTLVLGSDSSPANDEDPCFYQKWLARDARKEGQRITFAEKNHEFHLQLRSSVFDRNEQRIKDEADTIKMKGCWVDFENHGRLPEAVLKIITGAPIPGVDPSQ